MKTAISRKRWIVLCAVVLAMTASLLSQTTQRANRITQELSAGPITMVAGTVHPLTQRASDMGAVSSEMQLDTMTLNISLSAEQQTELDALLNAQQDPKSPKYHQWLTQAEYGARFGLTDADLKTVTAWLAGQGFTVTGVSTSRNAIYFGGKAWQVESAFRTQLHQFKLDGETHFANTTELRVPAGIGRVMLNVRGLNNFRLKPHVRMRTVPRYTINTSSGLEHFLTPKDWATIYNVNAIYAAGLDGTGAHVGVVGQTYAPQADIDHFRSASGLGATLINYVCIDPVKTAAKCTGATAIAPPAAGDLGEADLDIEWAGGIARNATVDYVYAPFSDVTANTLGVFDALQYAVQTYTIPITGGRLPVISMSYTACESQFAASDFAFVTSIGQQATTQGQTIVVASGDSGAAGCDAQGVAANVPALLGAVATAPGDSPFFTGIGGTTLTGDEAAPANFWNPTLNLVNSALAYIPESAWNETDPTGLFASGGGVSTNYLQPTWQPTPSNFTGTGGRFIPDVSFAAAGGHDGYMMCSQDNNSPTSPSCTNGFLSSTRQFTVAGGTSASAPAFAGMLTLLTQKFGPLAPLNQTLYSLASNPATYAAVFHDVTSGNNIVTCVTPSLGCVGGTMGWSAVTGYDLATGLGSIDGGGMLTALTGSIPQVGTYAVTTTSSIVPTIAAGSSGTVALTLTPANYTGTVTLTAVSSAPSIITASLSLSSVSMANGAQTVTLTISPSATAVNRAPATPWKSGGALVFCAVLLGAPFSFRRRRALAMLLISATIMLAGFLMACGGSGGSSAPVVKAARTYTVTVSAVGSGTVTNPAAPMVITVTVP